MSLLLLFFAGGGDGVVSSQSGGWLTPEQAAAQRRYYKDLEDREDERRQAVKAKQRELEQTIEDAYAKSTGKPVIRKALGDAVPELHGTPEETVQVAADVASKMASAIEGRGRRFGDQRRLVDLVQRQIVELERLIAEAEIMRQEDDHVAAMLLLAVV
jgi:hypothetical protein